MGFGSVWHWVVVLLVVVLLFGTKKLRNVGSDLGSAIKSFRKGLGEDEAPARLEPGARGADVRNADVRGDDARGDDLRSTDARKDRSE